MKNGQSDREESDNVINKMIEDEFAKLLNMISNEKKQEKKQKKHFLICLGESSSPK